MKKVEKLKTWRLVSIEPKMKCHPETLTLKLIKPIQPHAVSIGADSGKNNLPEPNAEEVQKTIQHLKTFTYVIPKKNLARLLKNLSWYQLWG